MPIAPGEDHTRLCASIWPAPMERQAAHVPGQIANLADVDGLNIPGTIGQPPLEHMEGTRIAGAPMCRGERDGSCILTLTDQYNRTEGDRHARDRLRLLPL